MALVAGTLWTTVVLVVVLVWGSLVTNEEDGIFDESFIHLVKPFM